MSYPGDPPADYETPSFPSLNVRTLQDFTPQRTYTLYYISDVWKFTVMWTLLTYTFFHLGAVLVALLLVVFNGLLADLPDTALAAVVIAAAMSLMDVPALVQGIGDQGRRAGDDGRGRAGAPAGRQCAHQCRHCDGHRHRPPTTPSHHRPRR